MGLPREPHSLSVLCTVLSPLPVRAGWAYLTERAGRSIWASGSLAPPSPSQWGRPPVEGGHTHLLYSQLSHEPPGPGTSVLGARGDGEFSGRVASSFASDPSHILQIPITIIKIILSSPPAGCPCLSLHRSEHRWKAEMLMISLLKPVLGMER